jgi:ADP-ribosylglycohydrolase
LLRGFFIFLEYLRELIGGLGKLGAYANLKANFLGGSRYISAGTLGKFDRILQTDIRALPESAIKSGGLVIDTLEAALWCFLTTDTYSDAVLKAVNLSDDTDTTATVCGALAGLAYGADAILPEWLKPLAGCGEIRRPAGRTADSIAA